MNGMKENNLKIKDTNSELDQFLQFKNHKHFHPSFHSNHTAQNTNANDGNRNSHPVDYYNRKSKGKGCFVTVSPDDPETNIAVF